MHEANKFISSVSFLLVSFAYVTKKFTTKLKYFLKFSVEKKNIDTNAACFHWLVLQKRKKKKQFPFHL